LQHKARNKPNNHFRVLLTSANNVGVDAFARGAQATLDSLVAAGMEHIRPRYVVRVHSKETEKSIALRDGVLLRAIPADARPRAVQELDEADQELLEDLDMAQLLQRQYQKDTIQKFQRVRDERVKDLETSLGYRMAQIAGFKDDGPKASEGEFQGFRELYRQFRQTETWTKAVSDQFAKGLRRLIEYTLRHATVVCTIVYGAAEIYVFENIGDADIVVVDEAGRVDDFGMMPIHAYYGKAQGKILVGDPFQLGLVVKSDTNTNKFADQMELSFMGRLQGARFPFVLLTRQYRMNPEIAAPISKLFYKGKLVNAESTLFQNRSASRDIVRFNHSNSDKPSTVVYFDIQNAETQVNNARSKYNEQYVHFGITLAKQLMDSFPTRSIAWFPAY
jgi:hypothetical protein